MITPTDDELADTDPMPVRTPAQIACAHLTFKADVDFFAGAVFDDKIVGQLEATNSLREGASWDAPFVGFCDAQAGLDFTWRLTAAELCVDACASGTMRPRKYTPKVNDLAVLGHPCRVARVIKAPDAFGMIKIVEGDCHVKTDQPTEVAILDLNMADLLLVGWIER